MIATHASMLDKLRSLDGDAIAKQYRSDQVAAHKSAVSLCERFSNGGKNDPLAGWAVNGLPVLKDHLKMAQDLEGQR